MWLLFAFSGPVLWAVSTHIDKYLVDRYFAASDTDILMVFTALIGVAALPVIYFFDTAVLTPDRLSIAVMAGSGVLYMGAMLFYLRAIQREEASVVAPLFQANILFTFALGYAFLHERLEWVQVGGAALVITGALSLSMGKGFRLEGFNTRLVLLMLTATFAIAVSTVLFKYFAVRDDFWTTTFWTFAGEGVFGALLLLVPGHAAQFSHLFARNPGAVIGINGANELINLGGGLGVRYASLLAPVALVSAISSTSTFFVFAFGILLTLFFPKAGREDLSARTLVQKGLGTVLIAAGVILIELHRGT